MALSHRYTSILYSTCACRSYCILSAYVQYSNIKRYRNSGNDEFQLAMAAACAHDFCGSPARGVLLVDVLAGQTRIPTAPRAKGHTPDARAAFRPRFRSESGPRR